MVRSQSVSQAEDCASELIRPASAAQPAALLGEHGIALVIFCPAGHRPHVRHATVVTARPIAIDHIAPPVVIVHAPPRDMQVQRVVEGFGDVHQLLAGLAVGGDQPFSGSCGWSIGFLEWMTLEPPHCVQGHLDLA